MALEIIFFDACPDLVEVPVAIDAFCKVLTSEAEDNF